MSLALRNGFNEPLALAFEKLIRKVPFGHLFIAIVVVGSDRTGLQNNPAPALLQ